MAKKTLVREYDKFMLRLPPGMRDRIKEKAERAGMSMNEAIVWVLEKEFPGRVSFEERLYDLANLVSMLKDSKDTYAGVENLISEIETTLETIGHGADRRFSDMVAERLHYWRELEVDNWRDRNESPFVDDHWPSENYTPGSDPFSFADKKPEKSDD